MGLQTPTRRTKPPHCSKAMDLAINIRTKARSVAASTGWQKLPTRNKHTMQPYSLFGVYLLLCWALGSSAIAAAKMPANASAETHTEAALSATQQRFKQALEAVRKGQWQDAQDLSDELTDYLLYPHLEVELMIRNISELSSEAYQKFTDAHHGHPLAHRLHRAWLAELGRRSTNSLDDAKAFARSFEHSYQRPALDCRYIRALQSLGEQQAAEQQLRKLWLSAGKSLPKRCDPLLKPWLAQQKDRKSLLWQRALLAQQQGENRLARYLLKQAQASHTAQQLIANPGRAETLAAKLPRDAKHRQLLVQSISKLARRDYFTADSLWQQWKAPFAFSAEDNFTLRNAIARQIIAANEPEVSAWLTKRDPLGEDHYLTEWRIRIALREMRWQQVSELINLLPTELQEKSSWRYWKARSQLAYESQFEEDAKSQMRALASERNFYGFLAADTLGEAHQFKEEASEAISYQAFHDDIYFQRAREFRRLGEDSLASTEWRHALKRLNTRGKIAAAQMAADWEWHAQMVATAISAGLWNDIALRFPLAEAHLFSDAAEHYRVSLAWLIAISRQESAFNPGARSAVGARGIMQIMPGTAKRIAKDAGYLYDKQALYEPHYAIPLGAYYLSFLKEEFANSRILATAAYNAGPGRIGRTLERQRRALPADVWIETLPYHETRGYIKNVLAFEAIYRRQLGLAQAPLIAGHEATVEARIAEIEISRKKHESSRRIDFAQREKPSEN